MHVSDLSGVAIIMACCASLAAGTIDSIVGGGGLILVPSLFSLFPNAAPAVLFGTNKIAALSGTGIATVQYVRHVQVNWKVIIPAAIVAWGGSSLGAWAVEHVNGDDFRKALPFVLVAVFLYTLTQKQFGVAQGRVVPDSQARLAACVIGLIVGFYDGFFGPGTGSFFVFLIVRFLAYDFLQATAAAKILNTTSNLSAVFLFAFNGEVWWALGILMAIANVSGSLIGTRLAVKHGAVFVRKFFILIVGALIISSLYKAFFK